MIIKRRFDKNINGEICIAKVFGKTVYVVDVDNTSASIDYLNQPIAAHINVSDSCNLHCHYCYAVGSKKKNEMSYKNYCICIDKLADAGVLSLTWSGGEPFLNPFFIDLLSYANEKSLYNVILSNATLISDETAAFLSTIGAQVQVGLNEIWSNKRSNLLIQEIDGYKRLLDNGVNVIATVMIDYKPDVSPETIINYLLSNNIFNVRFGFMVLEGQMGDFAQKKEYICYARHTMEALHKLGTKLNVMFQDDTIEYESSLFSRRALSCEGATLELYVDSNGDIYPCPLLKHHSEFYSGNILKDNIQDVWNGKVFSSFRNISFKDTGCEKCNYICGTWCRALSYSYTGLIFGKNPFCLKEEA